MRSPSADWRDLTQLILGSRPDEEARAAAGVALQDHVASSLLGARDPAVERLLRHAVDQGVPARSRGVLGHGTGVAPALAALVGGFQAHLLDVDDTHEDVRGHPSAVLFPTLLALAPTGTRLPEILDAYVVGLELMARVGRLLGPRHYEAGWHTTGTAGTLAGAAAGARLLGLDRDVAAVAISLAASQAGGVRAQFGTAAKPLQAGLAARSAVTAVQLAAAGVEAAPDYLDRRAGFLAAHGAADTGELAEGWGRSWRVREPGLWFKRYPFCSAAMSASDAAARLVAGALASVVPARSAAEAVDRVVVRVPRGADTALRHTRPRTGEEGRFSAEYVVALHLTGRTPELEHLSAAPVAPDVDAVVARTVREHVAPPSSGRSFWAEVEVLLADGSRHRADVVHPLGSPRNPLAPDQHRAKLVAAAASPAGADALQDILAGEGNVEHLFEAARAANPSAAHDGAPARAARRDPGPAHDQSTQETRR